MLTSVEVDDTFCVIGLNVRAMHDRSRRFSCSNSPVSSIAVADVSGA